MIDIPTPFKPMKCENWDEHPLKPPYFMQPKLKGLCCWVNDGEPRTRNGGYYSVFPDDYFIKIHPSLYLIGELWYPGATQQDIQSAVVRNCANEHTSRVKLYVFDFYDEAWKDMAQYQRLECIAHLPPHPNVEIVPYVGVNSNEQGEAYYQDFLKQGWEGAIYRSVKGIYEPRVRSRSVLKRKPWKTDEAVIIDIEISNNGKRAGMVGAFVVKWQDKTFKIGGGHLTDEQLIEFVHLTPDTVITFEYQELTNLGTPQHAQFVAVRTDA